MESKMKILLLEDDHADAEMVQRLLNKEMPGAVIRLVMNKTDFLSALESFLPDVILADNSLPQLDATDALEICRECLPNIPFIMVTGTVSEEFAAEIIKSGADDYILKDRLKRLPAAIDTALKKRRAEREKQEALAQQKRDEEKYRMLVERVSDGFLALDAEWNIIYINQVAEKMMRRPLGYLLGKNLWLEYPEIIDDSFAKSFHQAMKTQQNIHLKEFITSYDAWVEANIYPSATGISIFFRDATEQKKLEEMSVALEKEKEISELKSRFVSMASHEFRTPLSTVLSSTYLIQKYALTEDQPKREKHIQRIISSVNLLTEILNDFLSVGRIEEGKVQARLSEFNISKLITEITEDMGESLKQGQEIQYSHHGIDGVNMDPSMLKHIMFNLLSNATKFSPENSLITVTSVVGKSAVVISVKDNGIGISQEDQKHLMELFFRGENARNIQGTGLGMHLVSRYSALMNGSLVCKSELNKGTEFTVTFNLNNYSHEKDIID
jgi:PAS domain S-box-containing protein